MTFGLFGALMAISAELGMFAHWLRFLRGFPALARRKPRFSRLMIAALPALMLAGSALVAGLLAPALIPIASQSIPGWLLRYLAPLVALTLLGCVYLCCVEIIGTIRSGRLV
jgi:hypothetical protein